MRRFAAVQSCFLSAPRQPALGDARTEPGPGAAGAGLGRAGEFSRGAASLLRSAAPSGGDEDGGGEGVPASDNLAVGVCGALWPRASCLR